MITLATVYNRKSLTLQCLTSLLHSCKIAEVESTHFVVDDNSTDGTSEAIARLFPEVCLLRGTGSLYWAGGMRFGFNHLSNIEYDYLLAYNDDCVFAPNCLELLLGGFDSSSDRIGIVVGSLAQPDSKTVSYGGRRARWRSNWLPPSFSLINPADFNYVPIDTFNMNICCISNELIRSIGFLSDRFKHSAADYDYGMRANNAGFKTVLAPGIVGSCQSNSTLGTSKEKSIHPFVRIRRVFSVKEYPFSSILFYFRSHGGYLWPLWLLVFYITRIFKF